MKIGLATAGDVARLMPLFEAFSLADHIPWHADRVRGGVAKLVASDDLGFVVLAEDDDEPIGYAMITFGFDLEFGGRDAFLTELFVVEASRRKGIAEALLDAAEVEGKKRDVAALHLLVLPENTRARALYGKRGFEASPRVMMTKVLAK